MQWNKLHGCGGINQIKTNKMKTETIFKLWIWALCSTVIISVTYSIITQ
jgi:hypothetical protein